tara:strand:+ start:24563 stop:25153 length:591 start_codon:yes stop_codon:yes gene_type:complete
MSIDAEKTSNMHSNDFNSASAAPYDCHDDNLESVRAPDKLAIKIWVDGSFQSKGRASGVGIVVTDIDNNLLEEHSITSKGPASSFDSELMSAVIALNLPSVLNSTVIELHGDCTSVIDFLNAPKEHYAFEEKSEARRNLADDAREALCMHEDIIISHDSDRQTDKAGKLMRRAHFLAKCALQNKPLTKCKFLNGPV